MVFVFLLIFLMWIIIFSAIVVTKNKYWQIGGAGYLLGSISCIISAYLCDYSNIYLVLINISLLPIYVFLVIYYEIKFRKYISRQDAVSLYINDVIDLKIQPISKKDG